MREIHSWGSCTPCRNGRVDSCPESEATLGRPTRGYPRPITEFPYLGHVFSAEEWRSDHQVIRWIRSSGWASANEFMAGCRRNRKARIRAGSPIIRQCFASSEAESRHHRFDLARLPMRSGLCSHANWANSISSIVCRVAGAISRSEPDLQSRGLRAGEPRGSNDYNSDGILSRRASSSTRLSRFGPNTLWKPDSTRSMADGGKVRVAWATRGRRRWQRTNEVRTLRNDIPRLQAAVAPPWRKALRRYTVAKPARQLSSVTRCSAASEAVACRKSMAQVAIACGQVERCHWSASPPSESFRTMYAHWFQTKKTGAPVAGVCTGPDRHRYFRAGVAGHTVQRQKEGRHGHPARRCLAPEGWGNCTCARRGTGGGRRYQQANRCDD